MSFGSALRCDCLEGEESILRSAYHTQVGHVFGETSLPDPNVLLTPGKGKLTLVLHYGQTKSPAGEATQIDKRFRFRVCTDSGGGEYTR